MHVTHRPAQSLLEGVMAVGVILISTISATTLIVTTITAGQSSQDKIVAANLAREAIEVVRAVRDGNWLKRDQNILDGTTIYEWNDDNRTVGYFPMGNAGGRCYQTLYDYSLRKWYLTLATIATTPCSTTPGTTQVNEVTVGGGAPYWTDTYCPGGAGNTCARTKFRRVLEVVRVANETPVGTSAFATQIEYLNVTARITWNNHGAKSYTATERLYNWR